MKVDWKKRYKELKREHDRKMKELAKQFMFINFASCDIAEMDFGTAKRRLEIHIPKISELLGVEYRNYFTFVEENK